MLVLSRRHREAILIGSDIRIVVERIDGQKVRIGIEAPKETKILREELEGVEKPEKKR
jgi:carbon storage regulator